MTDAEIEARTCPWCSTPADDDARTCASCGAALAQRESLGGVQIPGLTTVDPELAARGAQPLHLGGPSPTQSVGHVALAAAVVGGPAGLMMVGGVAAIAGAEHAAASRPGITAPDALDAVGRPSEAALRIVERIEAGTDPESPSDEGEMGAPDPWRDLPSG
jgi:hypothetical protein